VPKRLSKAETINRLVGYSTDWLGKTYLLVSAEQHCVSLLRAKVEKRPVVVGLD